MVVDVSTLRRDNVESDFEHVLKSYKSLNVASDANTNANVQVDGLESLQNDTIDWESAPTWRLPEITLTWVLPRSRAGKFARTLSAAVLTMHPVCDKKSREE